MCTTTFFSPLRCSSFFRNRNPFYDRICTSRLTISFLLLSPEVTVFFIFLVFSCCVILDSLTHVCIVSVSSITHLNFELAYLSVFTVIHDGSLSHQFLFCVFPPFFFYFFSRRFIDFFPFFFYFFFFIRRSVGGVEGWRNRRCRRHSTAGASLIG